MNAYLPVGCCAHRARHFKRDADAFIQRAGLFDLVA
jgi:hypothetical protein